MYNESLNEFGIKANQVTFIYLPCVGLKEFENYRSGRDQFLKPRSIHKTRLNHSSFSCTYELRMRHAAIVGLDSMTEAEQYVALTRSKG